VEKGLTRAEVRERCGSPDNVGVQHKRIEVGIGGPTGCSTPGDVYQNQVLLYDCDVRLGSVVAKPAQGFIEGVE
jgi:hypothetical protein